MVGVTLRRLGTLRHILGLHLERGFPADTPRVETALLLGAAQILLARKCPITPPSTCRCGWCRRTGTRCIMPGWSTRCCGGSPATARSFWPLPTPSLLDTPDWLMARWTKTYGADLARAIAEANGMSRRSISRSRAMPRNGPRRSADACCRPARCASSAHGPVPSLPGYADGAWWVQDAAAALPARLLGDVHGQAVADLCAAPGGKTAQLAAAGAHVTAVDRAAQATRAR